MVKYRTEDKPAPEGLVIVQGFLNTWSGELGIEDFRSAHATEQWCRAAGLWRGRKRLTVAGAETLREFRWALRQFVLHRSSVESVTRINEFAVEIGFGVKFYANGEAVLEVSADGVSRVIGTLLGIIHTSVNGDTWSRFKCCELETCGWAFYDRTKNRSGRWCSMKTCGSRHKAREYLRRKVQGG